MPSSIECQRQSFGNQRGSGAHGIVSFSMSRACEDMKYCRKAERCSLQAAQKACEV